MEVLAGGSGGEPPSPECLKMGRPGVGSPIATPVPVLPLSVLALLEEAEVQVPHGLGRWGTEDTALDSSRRARPPLPQGAVWSRAPPQPLTRRVPSGQGNISPWGWGSAAVQEQRREEPEGRDPRSPAHRNPVWTLHPKVAPRSALWPVSCTPSPGGAMNAVTAAGIRLQTSQLPVDQQENYTGGPGLIR